MAPSSLHGNGKSLKKKTPQQRQKKTEKREHQTKYARESDDTTSDIRDSQEVSLLPFGRADKSFGKPFVMRAPRKR